MKQSIFYFLLVALTLLSAPQVWAQENVASAETKNFPAGEKLTYNVSFANFLDAGFVELYAVGRDNLNGREVNVIRAKVRTSGVVSATLLNLNDDLTSFFAINTNLPLRSERFARIDDKLIQSRRDFSENQSIGDNNLHDLLGAIYELRGNASFDKGFTQTMMVWENERVYQVKFRVAGFEDIATTIGAFKAIVVEMRTDDDNVNRFKPRIYLSNDERHLPVLIRLKHPRGEIRAEIASVQTIVPEPQVAAVQPPPIPQPTQTVIAKPSVPRPQPVRRPYVENQSLAEDLPFALGEKLQFEVLRGNQRMGTVLLQVGARKEFFGRDSVMLSAVALQSAAGAMFNPNDRIDSYINPDYLVPFRNEIKLSGQLAPYNQILTFDQERGRAISDKGVNADMPVGTHDILSFVYALRGFRFDNSKNPNDTRAAIFLKDKSIVITIKPKREMIEINNQRRTAILLTIVANDPQIDSLALHLWLSDDPQHLPLRLTFNSPSGAVEANLIKK